MFITPAYAQGAGDPGAAGMLIQFVPFVLIFVIMYFMMIRPQQKRLAAHRAMLAALKKGDEVITGGGLIGKVVKVSDTTDEVTIELSKGVEVRVVRSSISAVSGKDQA